MSRVTLRAYRTDWVTRPWLGQCDPIGSAAASILLTCLDVSVTYHNNDEPVPVNKLSLMPTGFNLVTQNATILAS